MLKGRLQGEQLIAENPENLSRINIKIMMSNNIAKALYRFSH
jgi:hypothetical protein